jgi:hypothetical protein
MVCVMLALLIRTDLLARTRMTINESQLLSVQRRGATF